MRASKAFCPNLQETLQLREEDENSWLARVAYAMQSRKRHYQHWRGGGSGARHEGQVSQAEVKLLAGRTEFSVAW